MCENWKAKKTLMPEWRVAGPNYAHQTKHCTTTGYIYWVVINQKSYLNIKIINKKINRRVELPKFSDT